MIIKWPCWSCEPPILAWVRVVLLLMYSVVTYTYYMIVEEWGLVLFFYSLGLPHTRSVSMSAGTWTAAGLCYDVISGLKSVSLYYTLTLLTQPSLSVVWSGCLLSQIGLSNIFFIQSPGVTHSWRIELGLTVAASATSHDVLLWLLLLELQYRYATDMNFWSLLDWINNVTQGRRLTCILWGSTEAYCCCGTAGIRYVKSKSLLYLFFLVCLMVH